MESGKLVKFEQMPAQGNYTEQQIMDVLHRLAGNPGVLDRMMRCADRLPEIERYLGSFEDRCRSTVSRCDTIEMLCRNFLCPGNVNFSQPTIDNYSSKSQVKLVDIVKDLGGDFVNSFPVAPGKKIRLTHKPRPGYTPTEIRIDFNLAGNGNNYSDLTVQFFLAPGGMNSEQGFELGNAYDGNMFMNKNGTQLVVPFMEHRGHPIDIGSLETLAVVISHNGAANNLDSAHVNIFYDNSRFYELCKARCSGGCATPPPMQPPQ